jgi:hypothetical protein
MKIVLQIKQDLGEKWLPQVYKKQILPLRTRAFTFGIEPKEQKTDVLHTLLGIELKIGIKRAHCPDLSTARYLDVFARLGCNSVAVPYDISKIAALADELESAWQLSLLLLGRKMADKSEAAFKRSRSAMVKQLRLEINDAGAGAPLPEFRKPTKQEKYSLRK